MRKIFLSLIYGLVLLPSIGQSLVNGNVTNEANIPLVHALILTQDSSQYAYSDGEGDFSLSVPITSQLRIQVRFVGYRTVDTLITLPLRNRFLIQMRPEVNTLQEVAVESEVLSNGQFQESRGTHIKLKDAQVVPSASSDFNQLLKTLPGVSSNNELSSGYQVRGGNFDENLVYVNDIPIYRPFLSNTGRQEGLSFVNPNLVNDLSFYAGGWEAKYGDKLSSSLNITYKEPKQQEGSLNLSLTGAEFYVGDRLKNDRVGYLVGARHRNTRYLLNSLEVQGDYFPKFTDIQSLITFDLTKKSRAQKNKTKLNWLNAYSRNRYLTIPQSQVTEFGSVVKNLRIQTAFDGRETLDYDTYQTGFNLSHLFSDKYASVIIGTWVHTSERENFEVEGAYRLCDVDNNPGSASFDECVITRGVGTQYDYGRNELDANLISLENRNTWLMNDHQVVEWGIGYKSTSINDTINEFSFQDSAQYVSFSSTISNKLSLSYQNYTGFIQYTAFNRDSTHRWHAGIRSNYWSQGKQLLLSPRINYVYKPKWERISEFIVSYGVYQQPPFYREFRSYTGDIDLTTRAQRSTHLILGMNRYFTMWDRPFIFTSQIYYKWLRNLIPYEIDNLRLRYYTDIQASGYATGLDMRVHGEFIPGTQSWFSFSLLSTKENLIGDGYPSRRRPTDQHVQVGVFFEDHMPGDPSLRVYLNLQVGSGFPFGPPGNLEYRNAFQGDEYYRADLGLSKFFNIGDKLNQGWVRLEVLNALGADNTLSYTWIQDVSGNSFAIPNSLSARLLNLKIGTKF